MFPSLCYSLLAQEYLSLHTPVVVYSTGAHHDLIKERSIEEEEVDEGEGEDRLDEDGDENKRNVVDDDDDDDDGPDDLYNELTSSTSSSACSSSSSKNTKLTFNGFVFHEYNSESLKSAIFRGLALFHSRGNSDNNNDNGTTTTTTTTATSSTTPATIINKEIKREDDDDDVGRLYSVVVRRGCGRSSKGMAVGRVAEQYMEVFAAERHRFVQTGRRWRRERRKWTE
jgi:hypothetical protein